MKNFDKVNDLVDYLKTSSEGKIYFKGMLIYFERGRGLRCDPNENEMKYFYKLERNVKLQKYNVKLS